MFKSLNPDTVAKQIIDLLQGVVTNTNTSSSGQAVLATDAYAISEVNTTNATYNYYGFVDKDGGWYIMREDKTVVGAEVYRYTKGDNDFATNWTNRAGLTYGVYNTIF